MARKTERVTIGGAQFAITQLGAVEGRRLYKKFVTAIGPLLREVISGPLFGQAQSVFANLNSADETKKNDALAGTVALFGPFLIRAVEDMPTGLFEEMCDTFAASCTVVAGTPAIALPLEPLFSEQFAGKYIDLTQWIGQCIKVNGFLGSWGSSAAPPAGATAA